MNIARMEEFVMVRILCACFDFGSDDLGTRNLCFLLSYGFFNV